MLDASYIYPTRGDLVMQLALAILTGQSYKTENPMKSAIVNKDNAEVMLMQIEEMITQAGLLKQLHGRVDSYLAQYHHQQVYTLLAVIIAIIVIVASLYFIITMRRQREMEREAYEIATSNAYDKPTEQSQNLTELCNDGSKTVQAVADELCINKEMPLPFLERLRMSIHENLGDSDYSVEQLAADMGLSRAQLYRKVKVLTGRTPVDIIRLNRLNRAKHLLETTDLSISEIAYSVGFTAPSYFTKCFKDEFGVSPKASIKRKAGE